MRQKLCEIWFDMDGTLADLYGVEGWAKMLDNCDPLPYQVAKPLLNMQALARALNRAQKLGYKVGVVTWLSSTGTKQYHDATMEAKRAWLNKHLHSVQWDDLDFLLYGTPKHEGREGILFDDNAMVRAGWGEGAYDEKNILGIIRSLCSE